MKKQFISRFLRHKPAVFAVLVLIAIGAAALAAPIVYPSGPFQMVGPPFQAPLGKYALGTDMLGRSLTAEVLYGARTTLALALIATAFAVVLGVSIGGLAGYFGGRVDLLLMRFTEMFQTVPSFLFAILLVAVLRPTITSVVFAISVVSWPAMARLVRGEFLRVRKLEFIGACISMGMGHIRIIFMHVLPNALSSIIVNASLMVATAILTESGLSFLGLSDPNVMSWGYIIGLGRSSLRIAWWVCAMPGIAILLTVMAINLLGDGLNDALSPRVR